MVFIVFISKYSLDCTLDLMYHIILYFSFGWLKLALELAIKRILNKEIIIIVL